MSLPYNQWSDFHHKYCTSLHTPSITCLRNKGIFTSYDLYQAMSSIPNSNYIKLNSEETKSQSSLPPPYEAPIQVYFPCGCPRLYFFEDDYFTYCPVDRNYTCFRAPSFPNVEPPPPSYADTINNHNSTT